jgi:carbamoylphosphate synthase large subunit
MENTMKQVNVLLTPGGGPGILAQLASLKKSKKYSARAVLADSNPASGNLYLPDVDARYSIPECLTPEFIPAILRLIKGENIHFYYSGLDEEMPILAKNRGLIEDNGCRLLLPGAKALENALNKRSTYDILRDKVTMPRTWFFDNDLDADAVFDQLKGKIMIKVISSRGGRHIYIPQNREEYHFYVKRAERLFREQQLEFMLQEVIEGTEYNVTSLHDTRKKVVYAISRRKFEDRKIKSTTTAAVIERREDVIDQAVTAVREMDLLPGFNNVECVVSKEDGKPYFIEVNGGRTAAQDMNIVASGVNLTDLMMDICQGEEVKRVPHPPDGLAILKIRKDVLVNFKDIQSTPAA